MSAATYDITTSRREYYEATFTLKDKTTGDPLDLSAATLKAEVRPSDNSDTTNDPTLDLNPTFVTDGTDGVVKIGVMVGDTKAKTYSWDFYVIYPGTKPKKYIKGSFTVESSISNVT